jgi:hypothetical protein
VYVTPAISNVPGVNTAVFEDALYPTTPASAVVPGPCTVNVDAVIVAGFIASLNVALTTAFGHAPSEPDTGNTDTTVGGAITDTLVEQHPATSRRTTKPQNHFEYLFSMKLNMVHLPNA